MYYVVLSDGETFTALDHCQLIHVPDDIDLSEVDIASADEFEEKVAEQLKEATAKRITRYDLADAITEKVTEDKFMPLSQKVAIAMMEAMKLKYKYEDRSEKKLLEDHLEQAFIGIQLAIADLPVSSVTAAWERALKSRPLNLER